MKKKQVKHIAALALVISLAALVLSALTLSGVPEDQSHLIDDLYRENQRLRQELETLTDRIDKLVTATSLKSWSLTTTPWADSTGADVTFSAIPMEYRDDSSAVFLVMRDGKQVVSVPCGWNGNSFSATAKLDALDGYSYYCQLTTSGGTLQLPLATPDSPEPYEPVYLQTSLSAYCNLVVNDWVEKQGTALALTDACAQVQLPLVSTSGAVEIQTSELVLKLNGADTVRVAIKLAPSEVAGSYDLTINNIHFPMQELETGDTLELHLEVSLTDGRRLSALGISWQMNEGKLSSAVG